MLGYGAASRLNSLDNHFPGFPEKPFGKLTQSWYPDPFLWDLPENWDVDLLRTQRTSGTKKKARCLSVITSAAGPSHVQRAAQRLASQHWKTLFIAILYSYCNRIKLLLLLSTTRGCAAGEDAEPPPSIKRAPKASVDRVFHSSWGKFRKCHHLLLILAFCMVCTCAVLWLFLQTSSDISLVPSLIIELQKPLDICSFYNV